MQQVLEDLQALWEECHAGLRVNDLSDISSGEICDRIAKAIGDLKELQK